MAPSCDETVHALTCCLLSIDELTRRRPGMMTRNLSNGLMVSRSNSKGNSDKGLTVCRNHMKAGLRSDHGLKMLSSGDSCEK